MADQAAVQAAIDQAIRATIAQTAATVAPTGDHGSELVDAAAQAVSGGKRMRAAALVASYFAHGGSDLAAVAPVAAGVELFQAAALVHDDVLDDAHTRRGRPTTHLTFAASHRTRADAGDPERFGLAGAVLAGDLALVAATRAVASAPLGDAAGVTLRLFTDMAELVTAGQYLDMRIATAPLSALPEQELAIRATMRSKTASYTAEFPLALGAAAACGEGGHIEAAREAGVPAGIAFQLRDDLLGIVGEPQVTGKPVGGDIREGKRTIPLWHAWTRTSDTGRAVLESAVGNAEADDALVRSAIAVIEDTGAIAAVEQEIAALSTRAASLVAELNLPQQGRTTLVDLLSAWGARSY